MAVIILISEGMALALNGIYRNSPGYGDGNHSDTYQRTKPKVLRVKG